MGEHGFYGEYAGPSGRQVLNAALQVGIDGSLKGTLETIFHMSYGTFDPLKEPEDARMFRSQILNKIEGSNSVSDMIEGLQNVEIPRGKKPYEVARNEIIDMLKQGDSTIYSVEWWNHNVFSSDPADEVTRAKIKKVILKDAVGVLTGALAGLFAPPLEVGSIVGGAIIASAGEAVTQIVGW